MRRLLVAPLLSVALFAMWLVLNESMSPGTVVIGAVLAVLIPWIVAPLRPLPIRVHGTAAVLRLAGIVAHDVVASNLQLAWSVVKGTRAPRADFVTIPLELRDPNGLAALALITTIVPGTVWSELAPDSSAVLLHVFDLEDPAAFVAGFKARYERPLMEIFE